MDKTVLLSFDVEEFDLPLEYGEAISFEEQLKVGSDGLNTVAELIERLNIPVTYFTTANFADHFTNNIRSISLKNEIGSHTYYHSKFSIEDLKKSRERLEEITQTKVSGLRMPRMQSVSMHAVEAAGYAYDSSINPTWLPGRYNNFNLPATIYKENNVIRLPASVSPVIRIPLFWLSFKNIPYHIYLALLKSALAKNGYVCIYFHPWEFTDIHKYHLPRYVKKHAGIQLLKRLEKLILDLKKEAVFMRSDDYLKMVGRI